VLHVNIGLESLDPRTLEGMNKRFNQVHRYGEILANLRRRPLVIDAQFIQAEDSGTVEGAIALGEVRGPLEAVHAVYLTDARNRLEGVVPLARLLLAGRNAGLRELTVTPSSQRPITQTRRWW
jgi:hypothetical protein